MIDFVFKLDVDGVEEGIHALIDSIKDIRAPLLRVGGKMRSRAKHAFEAGGPGWKDLDEATKRRKANLAQVQLLSNLGRGKTGERSAVERIVRDARGAEAWRAKEQALVERVKAASRAGRKTETLERRRGAASRQADERTAKIMRYRATAAAAGVGGSYQQIVAFARREVTRAKWHGKVLSAVRKLRKAGVSLTVEERRRMTRQHQRRNLARVESTRVLGSLYDTIGFHLIDDGQGVRAYSKAYIGAIHNYGGTAGHGARIPARPFLRLTSEDADDLVKFLEEHMVTAWRTGSAESVG